MGKEINGIVGLDNIFSVGSTMGDVYSREDDLLSSGIKLEEDKVSTGISIDNNSDTVADITPVDNPVIDPNKDDVQKKDNIDNTPVLDYKGLLDSLQDKGIIPVLSGVVFDVDGNEVSFDDMDLSDPNIVSDIISTVIHSQKEDILENMIDTESVSDFTKKLIAADKAGVNVVELLKTYNQTSAPIEKLDMENKSDQLKVIRHYVDLLGLPKDEADDFYNGIINKGEDYVEAKAMKYKNEIEKKMDTIIQDQTRKAEEKKQKDIEDFKKYKKDLKNSFAERFQLNENYISKAMDFALKQSDSNPGITKASEKVREMLMDPSQAPELILFLMNPDEFIKQKANAKVIEEKRKTFKMISQVPKGRRSAPIDDKGDEVKGLFFEEIK